MFILKFTSIKNVVNNASKSTIHSIVIVEYICVRNETGSSEIGIQWIVVGSNLWSLFLFGKMGDHINKTKFSTRITEKY